MLICEIKIGVSFSSGWLRVFCVIGSCIEAVTNYSSGVGISLPHHYTNHISRNKYIISFEIMKFQSVIPLSFG